MASGILDVWVSSDVDPSNIVLVTDCMNGYPHDLYSLHDGMAITLSKGRAEKTVHIVRESANECTFHYMELHPQTAKDLGLSNGSRCRAVLDEAKMELKLAAVSVSRYYANVQLDRQAHRQNRVVIGYSLLSMLGIRSQAKSMITVKRNSASVKLRLEVPENELDESFILPAHEAAKLGITHGGSYMLEYNHATRVLGFTEGATNAYPLVVEQSGAVSGQREKRELREKRQRQAKRERGESAPAASVAKTAKKNIRPAASGRNRNPISPWLHPAVIPKKKAR